MKDFSASRGLTTFETMVYLVSAVVMMMILVSIMKNANKSFIRSEQTVSLQIDSREAMNLMTRDIRNTGLKHAFYDMGGGFYKDTVLNEVAFLPGDSSSFTYTDGGRYDALTIRQATFDDNGQPLGIDSIAYQVDPATQILRSKLNNNQPENFCNNVDALQIQYGVYAVRKPLIDADPPLAAEWGVSGSTTLAFSGTTMDIQLAAKGVGSAIDNAVALNLDALKTYYCDIDSKGLVNFTANINKLQLVLLDSKGIVIASEPFLPDAGSNIRHLEITAPSGIGCHLAVSLDANGPVTLQVTSLHFGELNQGQYTWVDAPTLVEKKSVRAVRIFLMTKTNNPVAGKTTTSFTLANAKISVSDNFARRFLEEIVPIPNNGTF